VARLEVLVAGDACNEGEDAVVRQGRLIPVVGAFLIGCAVLLLVVGCSGTSSETSSKKARCEGRTIKSPKGAGGGVFTTNDIPGCPNGGLLLGTDKPDKLAGKDGDDKIRGLGGKDHIVAGPGNDIIYGGPGGEGVLDGDEGDDVIYGGPGVDYINGKEGEDVIYGGDGNDWLATERSGGNLDEQRDKFYCGAGKDHYYADKNDYVSSSCEKKIVGGGAA
jgi:hypothetical protein